MTLKHVLKTAWSRVAWRRPLLIGLCFGGVSLGAACRQSPEAPPASPPIKTVAAPTRSKPAPRIGAIFQRLGEADRDSVLQLLPSNPEPWLLVGEVAPFVSEIVHAYLPPDSENAKVRRGKQVVLQRALGAPNEPGRRWNIVREEPFSFLHKGSWAQVALPGRGFEEIADEKDPNLPFLTNAEFSDTELTEVVAAVRSKESDRGGSSRPILMVARGARGSVVIYLRQSSAEYGRVELRRNQERWEVSKWECGWFDGVPSPIAQIGTGTKPPGADHAQEKSADWKPFFFPTIDEATRSLGLSPLRTTVLSSNVSEIRVWSGFDLVPLQMVGLKHDNNKLSVYGSADVRTALPQERLNELWTQLKCLGIWDLPDSSSLKDEVRIFDGVQYVVELRTTDSYRTYFYSNPYQQPWPEARQLLLMMRLLDNTVGVPTSDLTDVSPPWWVTNGTVVFVRNGAQQGAFVLSSTGETKTPEFTAFGDFDWILRQSGEVKQGRGKIGKDGTFKFGTFSLRWSTRSADEGYLYADLNEPIEIARSTKTSLKDVTFREEIDYWTPPRFEKARRCETGYRP